MVTVRRMPANLGLDFDKIRKDEDRVRNKRLDEVKGFTDPQKLVKAGQEIISAGFDHRDEMDYSQRLLVAGHENTPTTYLLYLYKYVNQRIPNPMGRIPGPKQPPAFVTEKVREAAYKQLVNRNFELTEYEKKELDESAKRLLEEQLGKERAEHFSKSLKLKNTPLNSVVARLLRAQVVGEDEGEEED